MTNTTGGQTMNNPTPPIPDNGPDLKNNEANKNITGPDKETTE